MVIVFDDHVADIPAGKPLLPLTPSLDIPVAPVVVWVIDGDSAVLTQTLVVVPAVTVFVATTTIVPVALTVPQPPVRGIE